MSEVKAKDDVEPIEQANEKQSHLDEIAQFEDRIKQLTSELNARTNQHLNLVLQHEAIKSKMRTLENHTAFSRAKLILTSFMDNIRAGGIFRMQDEPNELYNQLFLKELINDGDSSIYHRPSLSAEEISRRNLMVLPHLRSSYAVQYQVENIFKNGDEHKANAIDDSMLSTQSEMGRGTAHNRTCPPTPSKNVGPLHAFNTLQLILKFSFITVAFAGVIMHVFPIN